ncbi:Transposon Tf2-6 polyprotein, partial [Dictyocoela muelleri]
LDGNKYTGGVKTINIFTHYFINGYPPRVDHVNLNSKTNSLDILQYIEQLSNNITKEFKTTQFDHEVPNTGLKIKRELPLFDSFSVDLFSAIELFKTSISLTNWDKETILHVLKSLCSGEILLLINSYEDIDKIFSTLLQHKYQTETMQRYQNYLREIKLKNFLTINEFKFAIDEVIKRITIHRNYTKREIQRLYKDTFLKGINEDIHLKFISDGICDVENIFNRIMETEKFIYGNPIYSQGINVKKENKFRIKPKNKWCRLHRVKSHDDKECLAQKKNFKSNESLNNIYNYLLPFIYVNFNKDTVIKVLIDSGATKSFIKSKLLSKKQIDTLINSNQIIKTATGGIDNILGEIKFSIQLKNKNIHFNQNFSVVEDLQEDMILGVDFLKNNEAKIEIHENNLSILNHSIRLNDYKTSQSICMDNYKNKTEKNVKSLLDKYFNKIKPQDPIKRFTFTIPTINNEIPNIKPYRVPLYMQNLLDHEIKELLNKGIIKRSTSLYASPCFIKKKSDGTGRLLIDYRNLNKISQPMQYHFPEIFESFHKFVDSKVFSKIDLKKGFYQVAISENDWHKTAFITNYGKYEFKLIPFGLLNAPKFFHNIISEILHDIPNIEIFIDDIIIHTKTTSEHHMILDRVLTKLSDYNAIINIDKCEFFKDKIIYLGFEIHNGKYRPDEERLENFEQWKKPTTKRQLQSLLGKINWYRKFIPNISLKLFNMYEKLKLKPSKFKIYDSDMIPVYKIYEGLKDNIKLYIPDLNKPFTLHCDASEHTIGSVLSQKNGIIDHYSKKLNNSQRNYTIVEKEMFSIYMSINKWRPLIGGSKIFVYTDNKNLLGKSSDFNKKANRWKASLHDLDIEYIHSRSKENIVADGLSRKCPLNNIENKIYSTKHIMKYNNPLNFQQFLSRFHIEHGHPGIVSTYLTLRKDFKINKNKREIIKKLIKSCYYCQVFKNNSRLYGELHGHIHTEEPLKHISTDIYGPINANLFKHSINTNKFFILSFTDRCTRFTKIRFITEITSKEIQKAFLKEWLLNFPTPNTILSDNAKYYTSESTKKYFISNNIKQIFTSPFNPTGNSISERINQQITDILRIYKGWDIDIIKEIIENRLNNIVKISTKMKPSDIVFSKSKTMNLNKNETKIKRSIKHNYQTGDLILIKNHIIGKLEQPFLGPFEIERISNDKQRIY